MTNYDDLDVDSVVITPTVQALTANGNITISEGIVTLSKAGVLAAGLGSPVAGVDDFKTLTIINLGTAGNAHTVTAVAGALVATSAGVVGDTLDLVAFNGKWNIAGSQGWTFA